MGKIKKRIALIIVFFLIIYTVLNGINPKTYATNQEISEDIQNIDETLYPGIKEKITSLQKKYPNWNFKILYTNLDWNTVIQNEYYGHTSSSRNYVPASSNYEGEWICSICGQKKYDNGSWYCASEQAIKYMMDPRNSLNESDIFQFEILTKTQYDKNIIKSMVKGTFLEEQSDAIANAADENNINPYYIIARLIQEQGKEGSTLTQGNGYNGNYIGYYNAFNIQASGSNKDEILKSGFEYAKTQGWDSLEKSINGGIKFLAKEYIQKGQDTLYLQKFDVESTYSGLYWHQYMQNLMAAQSEGTKLRQSYEQINSTSSQHTFLIPVYNNMPKEDSKRPNSTDIQDEDMVKVNVEYSLKLRNKPNGDITVGWIYKNEIVTRIEKATTKIDGTYWDKVMKSDNTVGYAARETYEDEKDYKLYLVPVNQNEDNNNIIENPKNIEKNEELKTLTITQDCTVQDIIDYMGENGKVNTSSGGALDYTAQVGTGYIVNDGKYTIIKKADVNGDGKIDSADLLKVKKHLLNVLNIKDTPYGSASDVNNDNEINSADLLKIQKYLLGVGSL